MLLGGGGGSNKPVDPYLSRFPDIYYNMYVHPVVNPHFPDRYLNAFNESDNHNRIWQYDLALDKYGVKQSGYFILETTVSLGMGITDEKLLFYHGISE